MIGIGESDKDVVVTVCRREDEGKVTQRPQKESSESECVRGVVREFGSTTNLTNVCHRYVKNGRAVFGALCAVVSKDGH
jgi:hypothetical protein